MVAKILEFETQNRQGFQIFDYDIVFLEKLSFQHKTSAKISDHNIDPRLNRKVGFDRDLSGELDDAGCEPVPLPRDGHQPVHAAGLQQRPGIGRRTIFIN
jgi:hypothetical protein